MLVKEFLNLDLSKLENWDDKLFTETIKALAETNSIDEIKKVINFRVFEVPKYFPKTEIGYHDTDSELFYVNMNHLVDEKGDVGKICELIGLGLIPRDLEKCIKKINPGEVELLRSALIESDLYELADLLPPEDE